MPIAEPDIASGPKVERDFCRFFLDFRASLISGYVGQGRTAFDPVSVVAVPYTDNFRHLGVMDMPANNTVHIASLCVL